MRSPPVHPGTPSRFVAVSFNVDRPALTKDTARFDALVQYLDSLFAAQRPAVVALQELSEAHLSHHRMAATLHQHRYSSFFTGPTGFARGGAALLVAKEWSCEPFRVITPAASGADVCGVVVTLDHTRVLRVLSVYVHSSVYDAAAHRGFVAALPADALVAGDLNACFAFWPHCAQDGSAPVLRGHDWHARCVDEGWAVLPPGGATHVARAGAFRTTIDHLVLGPVAGDVLRPLQPETTVGPAPAGVRSDHLPVSTAFAIVGAPLPSQRAGGRGAPVRRNWDPAFAQRYAARFRVEWERRGGGRRRPDAAMLERCLRAAEKALPVLAPPRVATLWRSDPLPRALARIHGEARATAVRDTLTRVGVESTGDPDAAWRAVRRFYGLHRVEAAVAPIVAPDGARWVDAMEKANGFAAEWAAVHARPLDIPPAPAVDVLLARPRRPARSITAAEVDAALAEMATGKASDPAGLRAEHLRLLDSFGRDAVRGVLERHLQGVPIPVRWRTGVAVPVPKPGRKDATAVKSYRPVTLTSIVCRLLERVVRLRIEHGWTDRAECQFGYRRHVGAALPLIGLAQLMSDGTCMRGKIQRYAEAAADPGDGSGSGSDRGDAAPPEGGARGGRGGRGRGRGAAAAPVGERGGRGRRDAPRDERQLRDACTLLVCIDASDAFCKVDPADVVLQLARRGLDAEARFAHDMLSRRQLRVRVGDSISAPRPLDRGVPQGSVTGPTFWSLALEPLLHDLQRLASTCSPPARVAVPVVYADDINVAVRWYHPVEAVALANEALELIAAWARCKGVPLSKLQATFVNGSKGMRWVRRFIDPVRCGPLSVVPNTEAPVKLLGVTFGRDGRYKEHTARVIAACEARLALMAPMARYMCALRLRTVYEALVLGLLLYGCEVWYPYAAVREQQHLESLHERGCRLITGCIGTTDKAAVRAEAGFPPLSVLVAERMLKADELLRRVPPPVRPHPQLHVGVRAPVPYGVSWVADVVAQRLFRPGATQGVGSRDTELFPWQRAHMLPARGATDAPTFRHLAQLAPPSPQQCVPVLWRTPYAPHDTAAASAIRFLADAPDGLTRPDDDGTAEELAALRAANERRLRALLADAPAVLGLCDGSVGVTEGDDPRPAAAGAAIVLRGPDYATVVETLPAPAGTLACSFTAETWALLTLLQWCADPANVADGAHVVVLTDSMSVLMQLRRGPLVQREDLAARAWDHLLGLGRRGCSVTLAFVFSHCDFELGDKVDAAAAAARVAVGERSQLVWAPDAVRARVHALTPLMAVPLGEARPSKQARNTGVARPAPALAAAAAAARDPARPKTFHEEYAVASRAKRYWVSEGWSRASEVLLYQLRCGACPQLGGHLHDRDDDCPRCGGAGVLKRGGGAVRHLFACPAEGAAAAREALAIKSPRDLWIRPGVALAYFFCWLRNERPQPPIVKAGAGPAVVSSEAADGGQPPPDPAPTQRWQFRRHRADRRVVRTPLAHCQLTSVRVGLPLASPPPRPALPAVLPPAWHFGVAPAAGEGDVDIPLFAYLPPPVATH